MIEISEYCCNYDGLFYCYNCNKTLFQSDEDQFEKMMLELPQILSSQGVAFVDDEEGHKVLLCSDECGNEFVADNEGDVKNIKKYYHLVHEMGADHPFRSVNETSCYAFYQEYSKRSLKQKQEELEGEGLKVVFVSSKKVDTDYNEYRDDLDSSCYDKKQRMICGNCQQLLDLDDNVVIWESKVNPPMSFCDNENKCGDKWYTKTTTVPDDNGDVYHYLGFDVVTDLMLNTHQSEKSFWNGDYVNYEDDPNNWDGNDLIGFRD